MSIAVLIGVHDGLIIAADSASTLTISISTGLAGVGNVYDNANKIFNLYKGKPIGCVAYGSGSIGSSSISTLIKDLRDELRGPTAKEKHGFDPEKYTIQGVAETLSKYLGKACEDEKNAAIASTINIGLMIGGYSTGSPLGESWSVEIKNGKANPPIQLRKPEEAGISWGGQGEALQRLILGYGSTLFDVLASVSGGQGQPQLTSQQLRQQLAPLLTAKLQAGLVFAPMPIQDAIDLARSLVQLAEMFSRFSPGPQMVGGPIEIAVITKHEGFKWISRKHYYEQALNPKEE